MQCCQGIATQRGMCSFHPLIDSFVVAPGVTIISEMSEIIRLELELPNERKQNRSKKICCHPKGHSQLWLLKTMMFNIRTVTHNLLNMFLFVTGEETAAIHSSSAEKLIARHLALGLVWLCSAILDL
jgi:hypothetical protein